MFSEQKWENTGRWEAILEEWLTKYQNYEEQVRMLFTPGSEPVGTGKVELPAGMVVLYLKN